MHFLSILKSVFLLAAILINSYPVLARRMTPRRMKAVLDNFMKVFLYPNNAVEAQSINSTLFADDIIGRVDITNEFIGRELNTEYIFGLFANIASNQTFSVLPVPVASETRAAISKGNMMAATVIITFRHFATGIETPHLLDIWFRVDDEGKIDQYEATFKREEWWRDTLFDLVTPHIAETLGIPAETITGTYREDLFKRLIAQSVCTIHDKFCMGENQQYSSSEECNEFIMSLPYGKPYQLGQNTATCRMLHQEMVPLRPDVHCPHIGPTGGGMCIDRDYIEVTNDPLFPQLFIEGGFK